MPVISLAAFKGGVGKTTSAMHLAALLSDADAPALVIDSDPNRSALTWARPHKLPFQVCSDLEAARLLRQTTFNYVIVDTPARPNENDLEALVRGADLLIIPSTPETLSLDATAQMVKGLPANANYRVLLTMVPPHPQRDGELALAALTKNGFQVFSQGIRRFKAYVDASTLGLTVNNVRGGGKAWRDWTELKKELTPLLKN